MGSAKLPAIYFIKITPGTKSRNAVSKPREEKSPGCLTGALEFFRQCM